MYKRSTQEKKVILISYDYNEESFKEEEFDQCFYLKGKYSVDIPHEKYGKVSCYCREDESYFTHPSKGYVLIIDLEKKEEALDALKASIIYQLRVDVVNQYRLSKKVKEALKRREDKLAQFINSI
jgi:hypothetical protein